MRLRFTVLMMLALLTVPACHEPDPTPPAELPAAETTDPQEENNGN